MDQELYTDADRSYRHTALHSGVPPPSIRDLSSSRRDLTGYNPDRQRGSRHAPYPSAEQRHSMPRQHKHVPQLHPANMAPPPAPVPKPAPALDMRTSTDFLACSAPLTLDDLCDAILIDQPAAPVDFDFLCSDSLVQTAFELREKGMRVPDDIKQSAKQRSNPFALVSRSMFHNADATKLAAMDSVFHLIPDAMHSTEQPLFFADLCGGPGGFSEYVLWRTQQRAISTHGFGVTLRAAHDWRLPSAMQSAFTRIYGPDDNGDILQKSTLDAFDKAIDSDTHGHGVHIVVADGAPHPGCQDDQQLEQATYPLLLQQIILMLRVLRKGGTFVCKFYDILHEPTADLVWLLYQLFECICVTKPLASDPTSSERFLVCQHLRFQQPRPLIAQLQKLGTTPFVARQRIDKDEDFLDYLKMRNMKFLLKQIDGLEQMELFIADAGKACLHDQQGVRQRCFQDWRLAHSD
ncbi:FtsJ-like methyltransferase-domain-containing protein [Gongronella butleri]|nr:FtsJ-like methyltransferase-domain-containing protein [Gongronella butleri]